MAGEKDDLSASLRLRLREAESGAPDYPDYRRGWIWGVVAGALIAVIGFLIILPAGLGTALRFAWGILGLAFFFGLIAWGIGAYRPQN